MSTAEAEILRRIPSVSGLLESPPIVALENEYGHGLVVFALREILGWFREEVRLGIRDEAPVAGDVAARLEDRLVRLARPIGRRAVNATGILLHTGLGRAPFCAEASEAVAAGDRYAVLQTSIETGQRCQRDIDIEAMLRTLTGCESATVVNNNAAATMLVLNTLSEGKECIVSRGQLVEIGGAFRLPDVMEKSGATLREVGTTNRTHLRDYENAINENTGAIIHVHTSNYRVRGFSSTPTIQELALLGRKHGIPVADDLGSGALVPLSEFGITNEPLVRDSVAAGADLMCFSSDKLICGPQGGIVLGKAQWLQRIRKNPFARMFRCDKLTLAGLQATLVHFVNGVYRERIPLYRMLSRELADLEIDARRIAEALEDVPGVTATVGDDVAYIGSGSIPDEGIPSKVVRLDSPHGVHRISAALRRHVPSIFGRVSHDGLVLDMRTLLAGESDLLVEGLAHALGDLEG